MDPERSYQDLDRLATRLMRDDHYQQALTAWTVIVGLAVGVFLSFGIWMAGYKSFARRLSTGAGFASAGYLLGLFVPSGNGNLRSILVFALLVVGTLIKPKDPKDLLAKVFVSIAVVTVALEILSALHPSGEPAMSFWGNPLISWRFYGLLNYQAAFIGGGVLCAAVMLERHPVVLAAIVVAALVVVGARSLGANFVGVLTVGFGGGFAIIAAVKQELKPLYIAYAAGFALIAFALALWAGAAQGGSHGARAVQEISHGGFRALGDLVWSRLRLNVAAIRAFPGGVLSVVVFLVQLPVMIRWAIREQREFIGLRIVIASCSLAALAALLLEDSGFKMSAVQGFPALILWTLAVMGPKRHPALELY